MPHIDVIAGLLKKLGGAANVERQIGANQGSVRMWRVNGKIPWKWRASIQLMADGMGIELSEDEEELLELLPKE